MFHDALAVEPDARAGFLACRCDGDAPLRREVEGLLHADARARDGAFLSDAIAAAVRGFAPLPGGSISRR